VGHPAGRLEGAEVGPARHAPNLPLQMATALRRLCRNDGQGLIELIVALTILAVGIGAVVTVLTGSALSLQRADKKGTALTLAETQIEVYRNLPYAEVRLADASWSAAPLTNGADPYFTAHTSDPDIPSGAKSGEVTDAAAGMTACAATPPPECDPVQTVSGPDHRNYRIDTYITDVTPTDNGQPVPLGTAVGNSLRRVTVVVRDAQLASLPILARNSSTFSDVNAASLGGKAAPVLTPKVPSAWVTGVSGTTIPASSIGIAISNGLYPLTAGSPGTINIFMIAATTPPYPCGTSDWTQVGSATLDSGNITYYSDGPATVTAGNTYWWYAQFTGDSSNRARNSRCSPAMASTVVQASKWTPSISVSAPATATTGVPVDGSKFTATLTNASPGASGTIHLKYVAAGSAPSPCPAGTELGTTPATGNGSYSQANPFPASSAGTYWWWATYDGDANNQAATGSCGTSTVVSAGPTLVSLQMKDTNGNGKVDQVLATFDKALGSCAGSCAAGWTLSGVPSGGTLNSVTTSGSTATLSLNEGGGAADTSVGTFTLALDPSGGIVDTFGRHGSFTATAPSDGAGPVPILMSSTNKAGGTAGKAEAGDTVTITFSEAIATVGGATSLVTLSTSSGSGKPVMLNLTNLSGAAFQIGTKTKYMSGSTSAVFGTAGSNVGISGNQVAVTLGTWNNAGTLQIGSYALGATTAFSPAGTIKDAAGNAATGSLATTITFF
jgi:type II secretory pathway pseudopilin PulG